MIIANPMYDVVFKYLLEDTEIARELLSTILGEEIVHLDLKPQETAVETTGSNVNILRFDFKAIIKTDTGASKKILIELQKARQAFDTMRFRRYLGENYRREDDVQNALGVVEKRPLPIVTIYLLGFSLDNIENAAIKVCRDYTDAITQERIEVKEEFIELLTHDAYIIQLNRLTGQARTQLERMLQVFSPVYKTEDPHQMNFKGDVNDPLIKKMVDRLGRAIADDTVRDKMDVEDEIYRVFQRELGKKDHIIAEKEAQITVEKRRAEQEKQRAEQEKQRAEQEKQRAEQEKQKNEELLRQIEELKKRIKD
jgi:hypothetical protein